MKKRKKIGNWALLEYDAEINRKGVRWLRVKGGFGRRGREDWVADVDNTTISVSDYNWKGPIFGTRYPSRRAAMDGELRRGVERLRESIAEQEAKVAVSKRALRGVERALARVAVREVRGGRRKA